MIFCSDSRIFALCWRILRRIEASSLLAASAISSLERMEVKMRSSRYLFVVICWKYTSSTPGSCALLPSPSEYAFVWRADFKTAAMRSSSSGLRQPPRSARSSDAPTSYNPPKDGEPLTVMQAQAALVSSRRWRISSASVLGRTARQRSFAACDAAWSESIARTLSRSSFVSDFSYCSFISTILFCYSVKSDL